MLLAEDNPVNQEVAEELLRAVGLEVDTVADGARAVELTLTGAHDLILLDVQMPVMDGLSAAREIRRRRGSATPIVAMTANAFGEDREACLDAGMNDHVAKPVDVETLYATLLRWLPARGETPPRPAKPVLPDSLLQRLRAATALDFATALANVGGQPATLERVLRRFVATYADACPSLERLDGPTERAASMATCHSLRGACAVLGMSELAGHLADLEAALAAGGDSAVLKPRAVQLRRMLADLVSEMGDTLQPASGPISLL